ncbi:MAG: hypothetical protein M3Y31_01790 [Gemmatimonadota bacterium]|nr:hypothetical protein [Gemmatimonadota bacterium]
MAMKSTNRDSDPGRRTGSTVFGMFHNRADAETAIAALKGAGFADRQISMAMRHEGATHPDTGHDVDTAIVSDAADGAATGAVSGGVVGGALGLLAGLGAIAIPGIGPAVAAGWLASTLLGAGVGAAAGGLIGGLVELGIPEEDAERYEAAFREGGILVAVESGARASEAAAILESNQADVSGAGVSRATAATARGSSAGTRTWTGAERRRSSGVGYTGPERRQMAF